MVAASYVARESLTLLAELSEVAEISDQTSDDGLESSTVEQLEEALTLDPTNIERQVELAQALLDRYLYEDGREQDLARLKRLLAWSPGAERFSSGPISPGSTTMTTMPSRNSMRVPFKQAQPTMSP